MIKMLKKCYAEQIITSFTEEGVERVITATDGLVGGHLTIRLDTVLEAEKLPASVTDLDTGLTDL